ncbi:Leucyl-tRNA synthetase [Pseudonocardia sp. Ae168_Ps1]|uniref:leucine--tRNA ligase n=1 Tax=unclassified Pseudonocardia TaxID=2619320 RepID=UPI00094B77BF|nr:MULTISPECIES: leucine--tRNA ligase [unclassified Pseudonocardia]OLL75008.1 Leucyl-tRNA synthetase [Pseudonocardia sp. Ae150A_Ps1]OLL81001.1 Leucyl-tRNA synthetase [Pseudonocardia sp. Ae168_Ps1]OLL84883.1 Leucyl-tRNA synthetase [Pseudonocardia sp. Ae263_Ps1]OLL95100.1 Leucyl-tRNA synthetase [Pseudonocardia sp. Ae356_Ps1]
MSTETSTAPATGGERPDRPAYRYDAAMAGRIERKWQDFWEAEQTFHAPNPGEPGSEKPKFYLMDMFPYPSGAGLHVGHPLGFIGTDVLGRYLRMTGHNVLHPMGFDAFGLPAEQYAVQTGTHPRTTTEANIARYREQLRRLGLGHDPRRSVSTTDIPFYRWTQWIFREIFESWYDAEAGRARPIAELRAAYESGERATPDGRPYSALSEGERRALVDAHRLAYISEAPVNWCPGLGTVLANEEVTPEGRSERGNYPVFRRNLKQWMMRITAYADRLADDLDRVDWPESVKAMQRNWIGRSEGARVRFPVQDGADAIEVFTTRPDTLFGATYTALAPEHPLVDTIVPAAWPSEVDARWTGGAATPADAVSSYRAEAGRKSELDRQENKDKTGVFTGAYAVNPVNGASVPVFVADYVLMGYGTGAIMAVPGQDQRDWDFATAFGLPVVRTVDPGEGWDGEAFTGDGPAINSANDEISLDGLDVDEAKRTIIDWLAARGAGEGVVQYKLRDWLFSRQRYWGEPFPIVWDEHGPVSLPADRLPVELPDVDDYAPKTYDADDAGSEPEPPLSRADEWVTVELDLGDGPKTYRRETNTMPQWAGSCWYYLRYLDPENSERFVSPEAERYWVGKDPERAADDPGGVDLYVGGVEHAVLHLLYSRFWHKVLFDLGHVSSEEPFRRLFNQGYIQAFAYTDARGMYVPAEEVMESPDGGFTWNGEPVTQEYGKMGKSLKNVVTPDEMCERYGADTFRLYEMYTGPMDASRPWSTRDVVGPQRFLQRVWRNLVDEGTGESTVVDAEPSDDVRRALHKAVAGVREDLSALHYNTAAAKLIELNNLLTKRAAPVEREVAEPLVLMMAPLTPHLAEELWQKLGHDGSLAYAPFPQADERYLVAETVEYPIQVNGKVRSRVTVPADAGQDEIRGAALADEKIAAALDGAEPKKVIVVPGRLVNIVR